MKRRYAALIAVTGYAALWLVDVRTARAQQQAAANPAGSAEAVAWLRYVADEIRKLRIEVSELRVAVEDAKMPELERGVLAAQAERQGLEGESLAHSGEMNAIDSQLAQPGLSAEELQQLMARKAELANELGGRIRARQQAIAEREAAARERVAAQQRRIQAALARRTELLGAGAQQ